MEMYRRVRDQRQVHVFQHEGHVQERDKKNAAISPRLCAITSNHLKMRDYRHDRCNNHFTRWALYKRQVAWLA